MEAPVTVTDDRGHLVRESPIRHVVSSAFYRLMEGPTRFQRMVKLDRLDPSVRSVQVTMTGGAGTWRFELPVAPVAASRPQLIGNRARRICNPLAGHAAPTHLGSRCPVTFHGR